MFHVVGMRKRCVENRLIEEYGSFTGFDQVLLHAWVETDKSQQWGIHVLGHGDAGSLQKAKCQFTT